MTLVQGYKVSILIDGGEVTLTSYDFEPTRDILESKPLGDDITYAKPGKRQWKFSASGDLHAEDLNKFNIAWSKESVPVIVTTGEGEAIAGGWTGDFIMEGFPVSGSGDGWTTVTANFTSAGAVTYTGGIGPSVTP